MANFNMMQALGMYNEDQVRIQTMYEVEFHSGVSDIDARLLRMQVYGNNFTLPDRTVNFDNLQYRAYNIPIPTNLEMGQDHSVTVYADVRGDLRSALLDWQALCLNPVIPGGSFFESNRRPTRIGEGDNNEPYIQVKLLAPNFKSVLETTYMAGARVTKVGGLELSNTSAGISTFQVDFKSVYWYQKPEEGAGSRNSDPSRDFGLGLPKQAWSGQATQDKVAIAAQQERADWKTAPNSGLGGQVPAVTSGR